MALNPKQRLFVAEYLSNGFNATQAYKSAGYAPKNAEVCASKMLRTAKVAEAIKQKTDKALTKREITAERVLDEIAKLAFLDPRKLFTADGSLVPIHELDDDTAASIAGLEVNELFEGDGDQKHAFGLLKKIKIADKGVNLERLGRYFKMFTEKELPSEIVVRVIKCNL